MTHFLLALATQVPSVDDTQTWVTFFREAGGWGVAVVLFAVVAFQWKTYRADIQAKDAKIVDLLEKQNTNAQALLGFMRNQQPPAGGG